MKNKKENKKNSKATNLIHRQVSINNGDVKFGARKDVKKEVNKKWQQKKEKWY